ncbi:MAG: DUF4843 domain-containing protein [Dysgonamonadaceae bacterium]|nr:DUF4843 domain-containing protein [Dysgonamonadaceae bacterium]
MKNLIQFGLIIFVFALAFCGCKEDMIEPYNMRGLFFTTKTLNASFIMIPDEEKMITSIRVKVMGDTVSYDRPFKVEVVPGDGTTASESQYRIIDAVVPAGEWFGSVRIEVANPAKLTGVPSLLAVTLKIVENENFTPGGFMDFLQVKLTWTADYAKPRTWREMRFFFCSYYSTNVYKAIIESCGITEFDYYQANPETGYQYDQYEGFVLGKKFGDWVRNYNATHDDVYRHDDGDGTYDNDGDGISDYVGQPIVPLH